MKQPIVLAVALGVALVSGAGAQDRPRARISRWILPGSDAENHLRYLQTLGAVGRYPWTARAFSSRELRGLAPDWAEHPWATHPALRGRPRRYGALEVDIAPAAFVAWYNTAFPYGMNDGAVWVGRGLTASVSAGASARWGPVELTLAPTAFWAENRSFPLSPTGDSLAPFADPLWPTDVDRPQRFGTGAYYRLDPGQSALRVDYAGVAAGLSNAHEAWGPMTEFPLIMGTNAPGFPHVFVGTARPANVLVGRLHTRVIYAQLQQSAYSPVTTGNGRRFGAGMVAVFEPRFMPGLEVGATRFFHVAWPDSGGLPSRYFTHLFESFLKPRVGKILAPAPSVPNTSTDNQLASMFARWALARSGFEIYGEYGREDHSWDRRDVLVEPDHSAAYTLGLRKAWWSGEEQLNALRMEVVNFQGSSLGRHRAQWGAWYRHTFTLQGHTSEGQLLATGVAVGSGSGLTASLERITSRGSVVASWSRFVLRDPAGTPDDTDVQYVLRTQWGARIRENLELRSAIDALYDFNYGRKSDRGNVRAEIGSAWYP